MKIFAAVTSISMVFSQPAYGRASDTISKEELRTGEPKVIQRKLKDQIWQMFEPEDFRRAKPPQNALTGLLLKTRVNRTNVPGLCRYDLAHIEFEPLDRLRADARTPSRATGITAVSYFKFSKPPAGDYYEVAGEPWPEATSCSQLGDEGFFDSEDAETATDGYLVWSRLQTALREGRSVPLDCNLFKNDTKSCSAILAEIGSDELSSVGRCEAADYHQNCYEVTTNDRAVKIYVTAHISPGPRANEVVKAKVDGVIVLSHCLVD
jgi:hypothetical protein